MKASTVARGILVLFLSAAPIGAHAQEPTQDLLLKKLKISQESIAAECRRHHVMKDAGGYELFAVEDCPVCIPGEPEVTVHQSEGTAAMGRLVYPFTCRVNTTDYYVGKIKKQFTKDKEGRITADFAYSFEKFFFDNIRAEGPETCTRIMLEELTGSPGTK